jgi:protein-S-isoprenylcysteine O-methyltransferase Ste14
VKANFYITLHKSLTGLVVLGMIALFQQWENPTAWVYLGLHASYGVLWGCKSALFPDANWERKVPWWYGVFVAWGSLTTYWVAPFLICWLGVRAPLWQLSGCIFLFVMGVFLHFSADMQKYTALKYRPGHLVTEGVWSLTRNPNYLGELFIYLALALLARHWLPVGILLLWVLVYWLPNMRKKDRSLARYPEFEAYRRRTRMFIPYLY